MELSQNRPRRTLCQNFTLIELITVTVIISILLSMIMPAIALAKAKAYSSVCQNNLKQIGLAAYSYVDSYDSYTMPGDFSNIGKWNHWINYLYETQLSNEAHFLCPQLDDKDYFNPSGYGSVLVKAAYIMNLMPYGDHSNSEWGQLNPALTGRFQGWGRYAGSEKLIKEQFLHDPANTLHIMDVAEGGIYNTHQGVNKFMRSDLGPVKIPPTGDVRWVGYHHSGAYNSLFGDLHIERMGQSQPEQWIVIKE